VGKIINGHKLTEEFINNVTSLTNLSYIKNMNVPKEISDVRENQASILYKEFNKFLKNPATDLANEGKPKLPRIAFETKECYFLRPKETNNLSSPAQRHFTFHIISVSARRSIDALNALNSMTKNPKTNSNDMLSTKTRFY
jgi:hypothetical protein